MTTQTGAYAAVWQCPRCNHEAFNVCTCLLFCGHPQCSGRKTASAPEESS